MALRVKAGEEHWPHELDPDLIAPCGMDCGLCMSCLRARNRCRGCRSDDESKAKSVLACTIRNCETLRAGRSGFCGECEEMPCPRLKRLDARYRAKYRMSMLDNLRAIEALGIDAFVQQERERWACPECGGTQCVHVPQCIYCGHSWT